MRVCLTTEISVPLTTEISVKSSAKLQMKQAVDRIIKYQIVIKLLLNKFIKKNYLIQQRFDVGFFVFIIIGPRIYNAILITIEFRAR